MQALIVVLLVCKNEEDPFKIESTRVVTTVLPLSVYGDFSRRSRAANSTFKSEGTEGNNISPIISLWGFFKMLKGS